MNYTKYFFILLGVFFFNCKTANNNVVFEYVDPLQKVFPESVYFAPSLAHADVARGEHASFQFAVRSNENITNLKVEVLAPMKGSLILSDIKKGFVGYVRVGRANPEPSRDSYRPMSGFFPDPIIYQKSKDVTFGTTQPLWVSVKIPTDCEPGIYNGRSSR
ncbi:MAG: hypothetical protein ABI472_25680 [Ginsengibacter sp.]